MSTMNLSTCCDDFLSNLPDEILLLIINKLPAETQIKLSSVSKQFKSRIRNPQFMEAHLASLQNSPKHYLLSSSRLQTRFANARNFSWKPIKVPCSKTKYRTRVIGNSAGGVLCLKSNSEFMLWNPLIQKVRIVPEPVGTYYYVSYGFGFDHVNLDFKVVQIWYNRGYGSAGEAMVYGVKSGCWRSVDSKVPCGVGSDHTAVHVNGNFYWNGMGNDGVCILGFDFANEVFKVVDLPPDIAYWYELTRRLAISSDGKSLVRYVNNIHERLCYLYCTSWSVWYFSTVTDSIWEKKYDLFFDMPFCPLGVLDDDNGIVLGELQNGTQCVVGVKEGSYLSAATEVNKRSEEFGYTSYTPSLALLFDDSEQVD